MAYEFKVGQRVLYEVATGWVEAVITAEGRRKGTGARYFAIRPYDERGARMRPRTVGYQAIWPMAAERTQADAGASK